MLETIYNVLATTTLAWSIVVVAQPLDGKARARRTRQNAETPLLGDARRLADEAQKLHQQGQALDCVSAIGRALTKLQHVAS